MITMQAQPQGPGTGLKRNNDQSQFRCYGTFSNSNPLQLLLNLGKKWAQQDLNLLLLTEIAHVNSRFIVTPTLTSPCPTAFPNNKTQRAVMDHPPTHGCGRVATVHCLHNGRALCGYAGVPATWPPHHRWLSFADWRCFGRGLSADCRPCPVCDATVLAVREAQP